MKCTTLAIVLAAVLSSGCAVMNTFQTPTVLEPGKVAFSPGIVVGSRGPSEDPALPDRGLIPIGRGLQFHGRIGVLPHVEVGAHLVGLQAAGLDAKVGFQREAFRIAANVGLGVSKWDGKGLSGFEDRTTHTRFGGIFAGYGGGYVGLKLADYQHRRRAPEEAVERYDRLIPGVTFGYMGVARRNSKPMMEISLYRFPGEVVFTLGMGVQILLGE